MWETICGLVFLLLLSCGVTYIEHEMMVDAKVKLQVLIEEQEAEARRWRSQEKQYQIQLMEADENAKAVQSQLAAERAKPQPRVMCKRAPSAPDGVQVPRQAGSEPAPTGEHSSGGEESFDPSDALFAAADRADDAIEQCRTALAKWPRQG